MEFICLKILQALNVWQLIKNRKHTEPVASFVLLADAHRTLWKLVKEFQLHPALCFLEKQSFIPKDIEPEIYNQRVTDAVSFLQKNLGTFAIVEPQVTGNQKSCVLIENGKFYGMGLLPYDNSNYETIHLKNYLTVYPENEMIRTLVKTYIQRNNVNVVQLS